MAEARPQSFLAPRLRPNAVEPVWPEIFNHVFHSSQEDSDNLMEALWYGLELGAKSYENSFISLWMHEEMEAAFTEACKSAGPDMRHAVYVALLWCLKKATNDKKVTPVQSIASLGDEAVQSANSMALLSDLLLLRPEMNDIYGQDGNLRVANLARACRLLRANPDALIDVLALKYTDADLRLLRETFIG